jgi:class 3 adenylate cyclase
MGIKTKNKLFEKLSNEKGDFFSTYKRLQNCNPVNYQLISLKTSCLIHGPEFPDKAFNNLKSLINWYHAILNAWLRDSIFVADNWRGQLPDLENELSLSRLVLEARNTGIRRIHSRIFRDRDGIPRSIPISNYEELSIWCDFMFELLDDDDQLIDNERFSLTFRYDKGVRYRLDEELKANEISDFVHSMMAAISNGKPHKVEPDEDWLLVTWSQLVSPKQSIREITVGLFIDSEPQRKKPNHVLLGNIIPVTWNAMRKLGPTCRDEPRIMNYQQVRKYLDTVKRYCANKLDDNSDNQSLPRSLRSSNSLLKWAGDSRVTLAIVFTDVVGATALEEKIKGEAMKKVRQDHFIHARKLIRKFKGMEIKTIGDSFLVVFKSADVALDFALNFQNQTGNALVKIRAGIHIGPVSIEDNDIFGRTVNFASRVIGTIQNDEIWISSQVKHDVDILSTVKHNRLQWRQHKNVHLKGFSKRETLWQLNSTI